MNAIDLADQRIVGELARDRVDALGEYALAEEQRAIGAAQPMQLGARRAAPPQADDVEPDQRAGLADAQSRTE